MFTLKSGSRDLHIKSPLVMGVVNLTPDSFYSSSRVYAESDFIKNIDEMVSEGTDIIDLGGQSSRPGATLISAEEEYTRIAGALEYVRLTYPQLWVSIDTFHSEVARKALEKGAHIINDISAGNFDNMMLPTVAEFDACYVCMHMQGNPETMQINPTYQNITSEILDFFKSKIEECKKSGINSIIIDPGFGFGKTIEHNYEILNNLDLFVGFRYPVLAGFSRKSMLYKLLGTTPEKSLNGTTVLNIIGILKGVSILRVHDVKEAAESIKIFNAMKVFK